MDFFGEDAWRGLLLQPTPLREATLRKPKPLGAELKTVAHGEPGAIVLSNSFPMRVG